VAVGWQVPSGTFERPIPGNRLIPFEDASTAFAARSAQINDGSSATGNVIRLYPNPTLTREVTLSILNNHVSEVSEAEVQVISFSGEVVYAKKVNCERGCSDVLLSLKENVLPGLYLVNVVQQGKRYSTKLAIK
jgi:hypothetical protein